MRPKPQKRLRRRRLRSASVGRAISARASPRPARAKRDLALNTVCQAHLDLLVPPDAAVLRQAAAALHRAITARGVSVDGGWRVAWTAGEPLVDGCSAGEVAACEGARLLRAVPSPPLLEVVEATLEPSQNWIAEQITHTLGGRRGWAYGIQQIGDHIQHQRPVDPRDVVALAMAGRVRRIVLDADDVIVNAGRLTRLYRGPLRQAMQALNPRCRSCTRWLTATSPVRCRSGTRPRARWRSTRVRRAVCAGRRP